MKYSASAVYDDWPCAFGHVTVKTYTRPWRKFFKRQYWRRCISCDFIQYSPNQEI